MQIIPKKGYVLLSTVETPKPKKGILLTIEDDKYKYHMKVERDGVAYFRGQIVIPNPYKGKIEVDKDLFLVDEDDILAVVDLA